MTRSSKAQPVYRISGASEPSSEELSARTRRYLWSMALRTFCFVGGVVIYTVFDLKALGFVMFLGALGLPYVAVVIANAGKSRRKEPPIGQVTHPSRQVEDTSKSDPSDDFEPPA